MKPAVLHHRQCLYHTAMTWLDTPFAHQGRIKGVGVDCIGLIVGICRELQLLSQFQDSLKQRFLYIHEFDKSDYTAQPTPGRLEASLTQHLLPASVVGIGDILLFTMGRHPQHVGLFLPNGYFLHAYQPYGKVAIARLAGGWLQRCCGIYAFPESAFGKS